jgi:hypothetical protein
MRQALTPYLTPPEVAARYGVDANKVVAWIRSGQLRAINTATKAGGRPRYRISPAAVALFEAARTTVPQPKIACRRRRDPSVREFF